MNLKEILQANNFRFNKRFGQNFISDTNLLGSIVEKAGVDKSTVVVEIGMGGGTLTSQLCKSAKFVYGYEIDNNLKPILAEVLAEFDNVKLNFMDIMKQQTAELDKIIGQPYLVVANLPYYITTPIIMKFIEESNLVQGIIVMVQEEVAVRVCANAGTSQYGAVTAGIAVVANSSILTKVNRNMFYPVPNVDSAVLKIDIDRQKFPNVNRKIYRDVVRSAFINRRKMLVNNLMQSFNISRTQAEEVLLASGIALTTRGETLDASQFVQLSEVIEKFGY